MKEKIAGIYEFINTYTDDIYVGQSVDINKRYKDHVNYRNPNSLIDNAIRDYGIDAFEFLIYKVFDRSKYSPKELKHILDQEEIKRIEELQCCLYVHGKGYNKTIGGGGSHGTPAWNKGTSCIGHKLTEETKQKISKANKGRKRTEEQKEKLRGRVFSEEHRMNLSKACKGRVAWNKGRNDYMSEETRQKCIEGAIRGGIANGNKTRGTTRSEETKQKISESVKNAMQKPEIKNKFYKAVHSDEFREKQSLKMKRYWTDKKKKQITERQTGCVWFNDGVRNYRVYPKDIDYYIDNKYNRGFLKKK